MMKNQLQIGLLFCLAISRCSGFSSQSQVPQFSQTTTPRALSSAPTTLSTTRRSNNHRLWMTTSLVSMENNNEEGFTTAMAASTESEQEDDNDASLRGYMRKVTGFSLTAFRATMRAATGISLTAVYASTLAFTSAAVRKVMAAMLSPLPPSFRYFLQPLLILYYAPLFVLRSLAGPTGKEARETHEVFVDSFKAAVDAAEMKVEGYWPPNDEDASSQQSTPVDE
ncbi:expressed unknown protein [Seminavis robusta]|uniref:Uncharacterized protein n=1 Tax=Seminavis robusta TaxID=568900 RepID=A0A9N8DZX5_9STRA|nr:expressed unknown protein [Seminavis robusta]|eukprot:Sro512_g157590.1 n/a (225) ;mRNA; r:21081-21893